jgi:hypothetical protein
MPANSISRSRKILYYSLSFIFVMLVAELCTRAYYYQQLPSHPVAVIRLMRDVRKQIMLHLSTDTLTKRLQNNHYLVRPGIPKVENDEINRENEQANRAAYEPWVEFAFMDVRSKYVNVSDHIRRSDPDRSDADHFDPDHSDADRSDSLTKDPFRIFFLGGSTTYGYNVTDAETISSFFVRAYRQKYPAGRAVQVINLGMPFYFSYQELIQLTDKLFRDEKPDMVIMLDGLNDCLQANAAFTRAPVFAPGILDRINPGSAGAGSQQPDYYELPQGMSTDSACTMVYRRYIDNIRHAREITACNHIPLYCFWQPVPYYNYPNRLNDPICTHSTPERFGKIYPLVKSAAAEIPYLFFLGDMLQEEKGLPFVDQIHYSPRFNQAIAEKMLSRIDFENQK